MVLRAREFPSRVMGARGVVPQPRQARRPEVPIEVRALRDLVSLSEHTGDASVFDAAYRDLGLRYGADKMTGAVNTLASVARASAVAEVPARVRAAGRFGGGSDDLLDWHRQWGNLLLRRDNPAFREGQYVTRWLQEAGQGISHLDKEPSPTGSKRRFETRMLEMAPVSQFLAYTGSGSDTVTLALDLARIAGVKRLGGKSLSNPPTVAFFGGVYGAGRGPGRYIAADRRMPSDFGEDRHRLADPVTTQWPVVDAAEKARLEPIEAQALEQIRTMAEDRVHPIGAIFIEPLQGFNGMRAYRPEFLVKLRAVADELKLPIIADEVLSSGGRTGKFFAFQHYTGFQPDFVLFGKGLQVNGLAAVRRGGTVPMSMRVSTPAEIGFTTLEGNSKDFHIGEHVLHVIERDNLIERAAQIGGRLREIISKVEVTSGKALNASVFGTMVGWDYKTSVIRTADTTEPQRTRLMLPLDVTDEALDQVEAMLVEEARGPR